MRDLVLTAEVMNRGTQDEFVRVFIDCHMGHGLLSLSVDNALRYPSEFESKCHHYDHKNEV